MITIIMPISRPDFLQRIFARLDMMDVKSEEANLLVYVDGDSTLFQRARNFVINSRFKEKLCVYRKKGLPSVNHIVSRRRRIGEIHNEIKNIVGFCDYVFLIEDDSLFPLNTIKQFKSLYATYQYAGLVTGVQVGRWGINVPGIWKVDNPYQISSIESCLPKEGSINGIYKKDEGVEEIDAAGLFCCMTKLDNYKRADFKPFDDILGPDFTFGINLRKEGFKNYVDWGISVTHLTKHGEITIGNSNLEKIKFIKVDEKSWKREVI